MRKRLKKKMQKKLIQRHGPQIAAFFSELARRLAITGDAVFKTSRQGAMTVKMACETIYRYGRKRPLHCICDDCRTKRKEAALWELKKSDPIQGR